MIENQSFEIKGELYDARILYKMFKIWPYSDGKLPSESKNNGHPGQKWASKALRRFLAAEKWVSGLSNRDIYF